MRSVLAIAGVELRRFLRDRSNIFLVFIMPLLLVLVIGSQFGGDGSQGRVVVVGESTDLRDALVTEMEDDDVAVTFADADEAREQLARGRSDVAVLVSTDDAAAFAAGDTADIEVVLGSQAGAQATFQRVQTAMRAVATERNQLSALIDAGAEESAAATALAAAAETVNPPSLAVTNVDDISEAFAGSSGFDVGAAAETLLFVFLASLAGSATLIQARRHGVMSRTLAAPVSTGMAVAGQATGRFAIAVFQGAYIMIGTAVLFGVNWGNIALSGLVLVVFSLVAAAGAMVIGSVMDSEGAAAGVGIGTGLILAALGGCMVPLEIFPDSLQRIAHVTPHAWAYEAFAEIQRRGGSLADILPQLGVLAAMAAALLALGAWLLRRSLTRAM
ncbi:ABC transporter permease [Georgenia yuyongxinii]|uniref:ABC transporter permease n=1 Tax=Georgenia yuyongxinii TaxID=2589797 RepID=UPI001E387209|nr:ABC transporter permease [Georgenia yuyongxinii]